MASELPQFTKLPRKLHLRIWRMTWPEPRIIEATEIHWYRNVIEQDPDPFQAPSVEIPDDPEPCTFIGLRLTFRKSTWLQTDFRSRRLTDPALEDCPPPITLQVCRELRAYTLTWFISLAHWRVPHHAFYFRPDCDMFWFSRDLLESVVDGDPWDVNLEWVYGMHLSAVQRVLEVAGEESPFDSDEPFVGLSGGEVWGERGREEHNRDKRPQELAGPGEKWRLLVSYTV